MVQQSCDDDRVPDDNDPLETEAQRVLQALLGGFVVERDVPPAQGLRDFDLVDDEKVVQHAVEVTSVQLPGVRAAQASMERLRTAQLGLTQSWSVTVHESADLRPVRNKAPALLNELTVRGIDRFGGGHLSVDAEVEVLIQQLRAVGVVQGVALPRVQPPRLMPCGYGSGSIDPSNVTTAVEAELEKPDNRRKLDAAPAGATRHVFVWLHDSHWYVSSVVRDSEFPLPRRHCCLRKWTSPGWRWRMGGPRRSLRCFAWTHPASKRLTRSRVRRFR